MPHQKDQTFGEWMASNQPPEAQVADRILGARVSHDSKGRPEWVEIQWQTEAGPKYHRLQLEFLDAMFLLSTLRAIQLHTGTKMPDDPRG